MKKLIGILLAMCLLCGCQLATEEKRESEMNDKLVGVYVTFEHMGGEFDIEKWLQDHPEALTGGDVTLDYSESMAYEERIPVVLGENDWIVPGAAGLSMAHYHNGEYWTGFSTEGLCEVKSHLKGGDNGDAIEEEATIFVPLDADIMYYTNPVYQTPEGKFYIVPAMGLGGAVSSGGMSQSISDEKTWTEETEYTYSAKYTIAVQGVALPKTVTVVQMTADNRELTRRECIPGQMPESITPEPEAAYLIVEEALEGETRRQLCQPGDKFVTVYFQSEQVWCLPELMEVQWGE